MKRLITLVALTSLVGSSSAGAQCRPTARTYCADPLLFTAALGYVQGRVADLGSVPNREMTGFNVRADLHVISFIFKDTKLPFRLSDALFIDATMGRMTTDTLPGGLFGAESTSGFSYGFGFQFLAGKQLGRFAVLGGLGRKGYSHEVGGAIMDGSTTPLIARLEIGRAKPIFLTASTSVAGDESIGARVDVPLFRRINATVDYWRIEGAAELWNTATTAKRPATANMLMVGIRTRELK